MFIILLELFSLNSILSYVYLFFTLDEWVNIPFFVVNHLSHGPVLALEDVNISIYLSPSLPSPYR